MATPSLNKKALRALAFLLVLGAALLSPWFNTHAPASSDPPALERPAKNEEFTGPVVGVMDGDTIEVLRDHKRARIRLYGVDCPEKRQDFGDKAKRFTSDLVFGKTVRVLVKD